MLPGSYEMLILARGSASLYRTFLSVWLQDLPPKRISLVIPREAAEKVELTINTVREDAGDKKIELEMIVDNSSLIQISRNLTENIFGFLTERDFILPSYGLSSLEFFQKNEDVCVANHSYWQRNNRGNSQKVPAKSLKISERIPLSTFVVKRTAELAFLESVDENYELKNNFSRFIPGNSCIIQSNRKNSYLPRKYF
jgi:hypothetical protein